MRACGAIFLGFLGVSWLTPPAVADPAKVEFNSDPGRVTVSIDGAAVATYVHQDAEITRPYLAHVKTSNGIQVTRNHPPVVGTDVADHGTYHPGIWMSFGDIDGNDYWRLKVPVKHVEFVQTPSGGLGEGSFAVRNHYVSGENPAEVVCSELCRLTFLVRPGGYLILWDAEFSADEEFCFGDQEEMGLGFRVATPIRVAKTNKEENPNIVAGNGTMLDAKGRRNGAEIWGQDSDWCDYGGTIEGRQVGMAVFCHPENFRPSWFHARDYGLLLANAFGRDAFGKGEKSKVCVQPGETLRLRYGVFVHEGPPGSELDIAAAYEDYVSAD